MSKRWRLPWMTHCSGFSSLGSSRLGSCVSPEPVFLPQPMLCGLGSIASLRKLSASSDLPLLQCGPPGPCSAQLYLIWANPDTAPWLSSTDGTCRPELQPMGAHAPSAGLMPAYWHPHSVDPLIPAGLLPQRERQRSEIIT